MGTYNWSAETGIIFPVDGKNREFTASSADVDLLMNEYQDIMKDYEDMKEYSKTNKVYLMQNPNVTMTILYGSHLQTTKAQ